MKKRALRRGTKDVVTGLVDVSWWPIYVENQNVDLAIRVRSLRLPHWGQCLRKIPSIGLTIFRP